MRILFASAELSPLCQTGGLGQAVSGLARTLGALGHEVVCALPGYAAAMQHPACPPLHRVGDMAVRLPEREWRGQYLAGALFPGVQVALLDAPEFFARRGIYGDEHGTYADQATRYILFARSVAYLAETIRPDVLVAHDWHAALAIASLRINLDRGENRKIGTVCVVHNNAYQGRFPASYFPQTQLPPELFHPDGVEAFGDVNLLKSGLIFADRVITVSPSYAEEIQTPDCGEGLEGVYRSRRHRLHGILNGIDTEMYDPRTDLALPANYDAQQPQGKAACRRSLWQGGGLREPPPGLMLGAVGRFVEQKGWDVLLEALPQLVELGASIYLLGDGDDHLRTALLGASARAPDQIVVTVGYDESAARRLFAGADAVLVPSRFEPCGLVQRLAQRYGAIPIAHAVGGLADSIRHLQTQQTTDWQRSTGLLFSSLTAENLVSAVRRVAALGRAEGLPTLQARLLRLPVGWQASAEAYVRLFRAARAEAEARS